MNKKIISTMLLTATIFSIGNVSIAKATEIKNNNLHVSSTTNIQEKSIYDNEIFFLFGKQGSADYIKFKFLNNNGKINFTTNFTGSVDYALQDNITVKFLTQGGSVEISRRFTKGTKIGDFKKALEKVDLKYGDAIQFIPEQLNNSVRIYGNVLNNEGYIFSNGLTNELGSTKVFKLTEEGLRANRYYPI